MADEERDRRRIMKKYDTGKSKELFTKAQKGMINGVASSIHKYSWQEYPLYMERGKGSKIYDVDGNEYIDYMMGFGPIVLGYSNEVVNKAVAEQLQKATQIAAPTENLVRLTDKICEIIPSAEKVSTYYNSGTEADMHAVRLARAYTGKDKIVKFEGGYHGWSDELKISAEAETVAALGPRNKPFALKHYPGQRDADETIVMPFNDLELLEELFRRRGNEIACVILEQVLLNTHPVFPMEGFLEGLRELTTKYDIMLIFDEVITGFRLSLGGAQQYFGVTPDISVFAKAMGNGYPISAVVGREDVVKALTATAGTFNGNPICVAASIATISELEKPGVYEEMQRKSQVLVDGTLALAKKHGIKMWGKATGGIWAINVGVDRPLKDYRDVLVSIDTQLYQKFTSGCLDRGIRLNPWRGRYYITTEHTDEDIKKTLAVFEDVFEEIC